MSQATVTLVPGEVMAQVIGVAGHLRHIGLPLSLLLHPRGPPLGSELFLADRVFVQVDHVTREKRGHTGRWGCGSGLFDESVSRINRVSLKHSNASDKGFSFFFHRRCMAT
ncbi:hypothetical protein NPIL_36811 [Nephila pilipes]|uniref:Uncharacterized protein n=1 Tax=Nephila pilipes TaxID=299642 RepID=A0A8X6NTP6_NEPPI|nr:hypothetical protein NPIL_36811 [Nephila pilipes]